MGKPVQAVETPRAQWVAALTKRCFSANAAESLAAMTALTLGQRHELPPAPMRETTTLPACIERLVHAR